VRSWRCWSTGHRMQRLAGDRGDGQLGDLGGVEPARADRGPTDVGQDDLARLVDDDVVVRAYTVPVDGEALGTDLLGLTMAGHTEQRPDPPVLSGLFDELAEQRLGGLFAEVGAPARQVPAAGVGIAL